MYVAGQCLDLCVMVLRKLARDVPQEVDCATLLQGLQSEFGKSSTLASMHSRSQSLEMIRSLIQGDVWSM